MKINQEQYQALLNKLEAIEKALNGGKGSGNWGHAGRPGKVGGSGKNKGTSSIFTKASKERLTRKWSSIADKPLAHPELAYIIEAGRKGIPVSLDKLLQEPAIQEAIKRSEYDKDTLEEHKGDKKREKLQNEMVERLLDDSVNGAFTHKDDKGNEVFDGKVDRNKEAFIVIGRPAGGKSSVFANPTSKENNARIIDSDMVKKWLPEFDKGFVAGRVQNESAMIAEKALEKAISRGENVVIPKVGGLNSITKMAQSLKDKGYKVTLQNNTVSEQSSILRAMSRFAETGRFLSPTYLASIGDKADKTFKALANNKDLIDKAAWKTNTVAFGKQPKLLWKTGDDPKKLNT